jgi:hypothetical protein
MLRYYIIREEDRHVVAIHKVRDSGQAYFIKLCTQGTFRGNELHMIAIDVNDQGSVTAETLIYMYIRGDTAVVGLQ